ncbi:bifunctional 4-hydroxy-2-oxoglutarate aldolase/2-dehydro-3-deoxy-phosphogluconate aldolase [Tamlana fucoidanivorans]|uniref:Bifunctional 4-hydroxy-2-oxoglutarate aldolase/2-dehydro-3-deoxy-phosphogluconate aldolase n=1 Tax=Allotamlana fucoidanivorans TaxID=2583814 RepID=A0A5C4SN93_9FLAO|nr:bifunctional 4-hydroxy-2-oxoglutarate aldolase/2-dehydro-3-deoxy-phosphogluconate aldolase [Tamlana fucoidanivorans]TNJ45631.1 bifunctional 4-hydroxy-2-oxoglutarate aldolase/2-dehydro-3-deoxy-phosphogluconate aldolase [Tamlana fucoidanivorans]
MNRTRLVEIIQKEKLIFVTRLKDHTKAQLVISSLVAGGAKVMEITSNTPNFAEEISKARKAFPNVLIGAGTVINKQVAKAAIKAGAQFLVTPNTSKKLISLAHKNGIPILMGALTPSEVCNAWEAGADFVKLFPADIMGIPYLKSIKAPLNKVNLFAVGSINLDDVKEWFDSGAQGIGIASILREPIETDEDLDYIKQNAANFILKVKEV